MATLNLETSHLETSRLKTSNLESSGQCDISIIIVSFNTKDLTQHCLQKIVEHAGTLRYEILLVDNASSDGSADMVEKKFPKVVLFRSDKNRGFAGGNNIAIKKARGRFILLLNSDAFLSKGALEKSMAHMEAHKNVGILGCKLTNPDGTMQPSARMLPSPLNKILRLTGLAARFPKSKFFGRVDFTWWHHETPRTVGWVVGAYFFIRRELLDELPGLDERYFLYYEEIDYCLAAQKAGWQVAFSPEVSIVHLGGQSSLKTKERISRTGRQMMSIRIKSELRYQHKWYGFIGVLFSTLIEISWNMIVLFRNIFRVSNKGSLKRDEALTTLKLIFSILWHDRWGRGEQKAY